MTGRRTFLALLGATVGTAAVGGAPDESTTQASQSAGFVREADAEADLEPADALLAYVEALYGDRLGEADLETVRAGIEGSLGSGDAFREVGLENGDEPAYGFRAYRDWGEGS